MDNTGSVSRRLIVAALVVNVAAVLAELLWHPAQYGPRQLKVLIPVLLSLGAVAFAGASFVRAKARERALVVRPGVGYVAPADRRVGYLLVSLLLIAALSVWAVRQHRFDAGIAGLGRLLDLLVAIVLISSAVVVSMVSYLLAGVVLSGRPRLELTPDGVLRYHAFRRRAVRWDELTPGQPTDQPAPDALTLSVRGSGAAAPVPLQLYGLGVPTGFLADAIRFYVDHPEHRPEIGTQSGYDHLVTTLNPAP